MAAVIGTLRAELSANIAEFTTAFGRARGEVAQLARRFDRVGRGMQSFGRNMSLYVTGPVIAAGAGVIRLAGDFETSMNRVGAITGATGADFERLRDRAREMGATTVFSASEAADALGFLAMAGFEVQEQIDALPGTLNLAAAAQMELADAADLVSNVLTGYRLEVSELARVSDAMTRTFTSSNTSLQQLGDAFAYAGPIAAAAGVDFEETAAALGLLGNAGFQGERGGTALRGAMGRILDATPEMTRAMEDAGLSFTDAHGQLIPLVDIIRQLEPHADDAGLMMQLFGQRAGPAMAGLVGQGSEALEELTASVRASGGATEEVASRQMQGFNGAMREMRSALEELALSIADSGILEFVTDLMRGAAQLFRSLAETNPELLRVGTIVAAVAAAMGPLLVILGTLISSIGTIVAVVGPLIAGFAALSPPVLAVGAAVGALIAVWALFGDEVGEILSSLQQKFTDVLGPRLQEMFSEIGRVASALWEGPLGEGIRAVIGYLGDLAVAVFDVLGDHFVRIVSGAIELVTGFVRHIQHAVDLIAALLTGDWAGAWEAATAMVQNMFNTLANVAEALVPGVTDSMRRLYEGVRTWLMDRLGGVLDWVGNKVDEVRQFFADLYDAVIGHSYIPDMVNGIAEWMAKLPQVMIEPAQQAATATAEAFENAAEAVTDHVEDMATDSADTVESIWSQAITGIGDGLAKMVQDGEVSLNSLAAMAVRVLSDIGSQHFGGINFGGQGGGFGGGQGGGGDMMGSIVSGLGSFFGGFRANGGAVTAGRSYVVGERGPELFTPSHSGGIVANENMSGGGKVEVNINGVTDPNQWRQARVNIAADISRAVAMGQRGQ